MSRGRLPPAGRIGERGSAVVSVLVLLAATLLVVVGARLFGGAAVRQLRCQGDAVGAIGSGSASGCGDGAERARLSGSPAPAGSSSAETPRPRPRPRPDGHAGDSATALASLFDVVESDAERTAQNQVTEEELDAIVELHDAIREQRTSLMPSERARPYWNTITADLALILQTEGGRVVLERLAHHTKWTVLDIAFVRNEDGNEDPDLGLDPTSASADYDGYFGYVTYAPGMWVRLPDIDTELNPWAVWRADVALYHELIHVRDYLDDTGDPRIASEEGVEFSAMEYQAVGIGPWLYAPVSENAYRGARREIGRLGTGAAIGDAGMPDRPRYIPLLPPAGPPG